MSELPEAFTLIQSLRVALLHMEQWGYGELESPEVLVFLRTLETEIWEMVDQMEGNDRS